MNILSTIHTKYQGETMFCFVCAATVFGYILGVNRVVDAIMSKHFSSSPRVKMLNKYTQTNLNDLTQLLSSNNIIFSKSKNVHDDSSNDDSENNEHVNAVPTFDQEEQQEKQEEQQEKQEEEKQEEEKQEEEKQEQQEQQFTSPPPSSSTSEEDYELVRKTENGSHLKNKNMKYFEWLNIF